MYQTQIIDFVGPEVQDVKLVSIFTATVGNGKQCVYIQGEKKAALLKNNARSKRSIF